MISMTEKRYFKKIFGEEYYIFDSNVISESDFELKLEYQQYKAFEDSMAGSQIVNRLNELDDEKKRLTKQLNIYIVDYNGLNCEYHWLKAEKEKIEKENEELKLEIVSLKEKLGQFDKDCEKHAFKVEKENKELKEEVKSLKKQNKDYFKNINNLILDNTIFKNEILALQKRDRLIRHHLYDNGPITIDEYNEIVNRLYMELRNKIK